MLVYLNGELVEAAEARLSPFDRGFLFGDSVYEGLRAFDGVIVAPEMHAARLGDGLRETRIEGFDAGEMEGVALRVLEANGLRDGFVYIQVSRGSPEVARTAPAQLRARTPRGMGATVFAYCAPAATLEECARGPAEKVCALCEDLRWSRGHVKANSLLGGILGAYEAAESGADDAIFVRGGCATESVSANLFVVRGGAVATPPVRGGAILDGVTRRLLLEADGGIEVREIARDELFSADEVLLAGTLTMVTAVTAIDGRAVGDGSAGPTAHRLLGSLVERIRAYAARGVH